MGFLSTPFNTPSFDLLRGTILALNPTLYYTCRNVTGTTLEDLGSQGLDLSAAGSPVASYGRLIPADPTGLYIRLPTGNNRYSATNTLTVPFNVDYTALGIVLPLTSADGIYAFSVGGAGETEVANYQTGLHLFAGNLEIQQLWEHGAGINDLIDSNIPCTIGVPYLIASVKDSTAGNVTFYKNAIKCVTPSFVNEPTGGTNASVVASVGNATSSVGNSIIGHVAFWLGTKLTDAQIANIARAAGLFGPP